MVGGFADPSFEAIVALAPTLVVGAHGPAGPAFAERLRAQGVAVYFPETESFDQIVEMLTGLGALLDHVASARAVTLALQTRKAAVLSAIQDLPPPRAVMLFDVGPIIAAGPGGFPDEMMRLARARNLISEGGAYPTIGLERLLALDPELILDGVSAGVEGPSPLAAKRGAPGWKSLQAFAKNRVQLVGSTVLRPGPRIAEGLAALARAIHGDALVLQ
jgi:iron complex transport system substrate-binding protein